MADNTGVILVSLNPNDAKDAALAATADTVSQYFTSNPRLEYIGIAGIGRHGGALLFSERDSDDDEIRKIVVKYSLDVEADADLRNEHGFLQLLQGAEHIVQLIPLTETELDVTGTGRRPTLAMEYIPYGTVEQFRNRLQSLEEPPRIPSRLLWRFFLCAVRQVVAMQYPPMGGPNAKVERERIRAGHELGITQNSPHARNFLFGDITEGSPEHGLAPILKLIDFGRGESGSVDNAYIDNIAGAAFMIAYISLSRLRDERAARDAGQRHWEYVVDPGGNPLTLVSTAQGAFLNMRDIDGPLRDIIAMCLAHRTRHIPELGNLLATCEDAVGRRRPEDLLFAQSVDLAEETDEAIQEFVQRHFLDAYLPE
ncbi:hypothetical protein F4677DRAFT_462426 [Hypoxylon crocopeplum]|nr:hypothetical protein F4677DRAFT_462426 [Hypoxylon crocopeplum]